jgi:hypothetical protein
MRTSKKVRMATKKQQRDGQKGWTAVGKRVGVAEKGEYRDTY